MGLNSEKNRKDVLFVALFAVIVYVIFSLTCQGTAIAAVIKKPVSKKVTICHIPAGNPKKAQTITVDESAVAAHLKHGDFLGSCDSDGDGVHTKYDNCPNVYNPDQKDSDRDGAGDACDKCANDAVKKEPGICGCGVADTDSDGDGTADCNDKCPGDANKTEAGICGCGITDKDSDNDGAADCNDKCADDPLKTVSGICGCGAADIDADKDGTYDCSDNCPSDVSKTEPGFCGCGVADTDIDNDGTADCNDSCATDPNKTEPGDCGCDVADTDSNCDNVADCNEAKEDSLYYGGFFWKLLKDYTAGTVRYSTLGNPDKDSNGNPAWSYEWINTSDIGINDPWYLKQSALLTWDSFDYNRNFWATNDGGVNLNQWVVNYSLSNNGIGKAPLIRWTNPTGRSIKVNIYGSFRLNWYGLNVNPNWRVDGNYWTSYLVGSPADINLAVGYYDASEKRTVVLSSNRVSKPYNGETTCVAPNYDACDHAFVYVNSTVSVDPGDSIFWTARPLKYYTDRNRWITMDHGNVTISIIPESTLQNYCPVIENNKFYAVEPAGAIDRLISIDPETGAVKTALKLFGQKGFRSNALAFSPDGRLYGWDNTNSQLYRIDLPSGEIIHVGNGPAMYQWVNGLTFDKEGKLYGLHGPTDELLSINTETGGITVIGKLGIDIKHNGMAVDFNTGELYGVSGVDKDYLFRIHKETGLAEIIGPLGVTTGGVGVEFNPVTGELFAVRGETESVLMKIDINTGLATRVEVLGDKALPTSLAAPWPSLRVD